MKHKHTLSSPGHFSNLLSLIRLIFQLDIGAFKGIHTSDYFAKAVHHHFADIWKLLSDLGSTELDRNVIRTAVIATYNNDS